MKNRRVYHRLMTKKKLRHKLNIIKTWYTCDKYYDYVLQHPRILGKLDKGKTHCSCPICSRKTKYFGLPARDRRKKGFIIE